MRRATILPALALAIFLPNQELLAESLVYHPDSVEQALAAVSEIKDAIDQHNQDIDDKEEAEAIAEVAEQIGAENIDELEEEVNKFKKSFEKFKKSKGLPSDPTPDGGNGNGSSNEGESEPDDSDPFVDKFKTATYKKGQKYIFILPNEDEIWVYIGRNFAHEDKLTVTVINVSVG